MMASGRLAHAFLFVGPDGVGKGTLARALVAELVGDAQTHPDVVVIRRLTDEKTGKIGSAITVDQIRELVERLSMTAIGGERKAAIIEEAEFLNPSATNGLLKTLEEPRGDATIILCASTVESVPATIASRCQLIRLHPVPRRDIATALVERGLGKSDALEIATASAGRPGLALRMVQQSDTRAQIEAAQSTLNTLKREGVAGRLRIAAELLPKDEANKSTVAQVLLGTWETMLRDELLQTVAAGGDALPLARTLTVLRDTREILRRNVNPQLALERVLLSL